MKSYAIFSLIFAMMLSSDVFAQKEWRLKAFVGMSDAALLERVDFYGGASYEVKDFYELGFRIGKKWNQKWGIETGLSYSFAEVFVAPNWPPGTNPFPPTNNLTYIKEFSDFRMLSLPVLVSYQLFDFLAIQTGPMLSHQLSEIPTYKQSGLGYLVGLRVSHDFEKIGVFLQPNFKRHAVLSFEQGNYRLTEFGLQFGVSYLLGKRN